MGVWDKFGKTKNKPTKATFIVKAPKTNSKTFFKLERNITEEWIYVVFPKDFEGGYNQEAHGVPGKYEWITLINGKQVDSGSVEFKSP